MKFSQYYLPTLKEEPKEAENISHKLMIRAGMIRKVAAGIYDLLPYGLRVIRKVEAIVREEMNRSGAHEVLLPAIQPAELWEESGRWKFYGKELLRIKDRSNRDFCFGPTHEEVIVDLVRKDIRSYKELPLNLYQIQTKFRDEIRPRFGLMRGREFIMKDAYSFHADESSLHEHYEIMHATYTRIFTRCGLNFRPVEADSGAIGGDVTHEFHVLADTGEDTIVTCPTCNYTANLEKATSSQEKFVQKNSTGTEEKQREEVLTTNLHAVEDVARFFHVTPNELIKTLIYVADNEPVAALIRGDQNLNEVKLKNYLCANEITMASEEVIKKVTGGQVGFSGPIGLTCKVIADYSISGMKNFIIGANKADYHFKNTNFTRDFQEPTYTDLRIVTEGDKCPKCSALLMFKRGIEVGQIFKLGTKYSKNMNLTILDKQGKPTHPIMGCYGIGIGRTAQAAIEQNHDNDGIIFPMGVTPFEVIILNLGTQEEKINRAAEELYHKLLQAKCDVLYDDRELRPGFKFKDADLIGIPIHIRIGKKYIENNTVELVIRKDKHISELSLSEAIEKIHSIIAKELSHA